MRMHAKQSIRLGKISSHVWIAVLIVMVVSGYPTSMQAEKSPTFENIPPETAHELIQKRQGGNDFDIIDVRTPQELAGTGYIEHAINIDYRSETFQNELNKLDKTKTYLIYCRTGGRSSRTLMLMEELGFQDVYNMTGGILQWIREERPVTKDAQ